MNLIRRTQIKVAIDIISHAMAEEREVLREEQRVNGQTVFGCQMEAAALLMKKAIDKLEEANRIKHRSAE